MTDYYVYSGGSNTSPYDTWAKAVTNDTNFTSMLALLAAGDNIYADSGTTIQKSTFWGQAWPQSAAVRANPPRLLSVDRGGRTTGTGNSGLLAGFTLGQNADTSGFQAKGSFYAYGVHWLVSGGGSGGPLSFNTDTQGRDVEVHDTCTFELANNQFGQSFLVFGPAGGTNDQPGFNRCVNCTYKPAHIVNWLGAQNLEWIGGSVDTSLVVPSIFLQIRYGLGAGLKIFRGMDLSGLGSGKKLVDANAGSGNCFTGHVKFFDCKLGASVTKFNTAVDGAEGMTTVEFVNCDSGSTNYVFQRSSQAGTTTTETTIVKSGGASDGTTAYSHKVVTTAQTSFVQPYFASEGQIWNTSTGSSKTLTIEIISDNITFNNDEVWVEVIYPKDSGDPLGGLDLSSRKTDILATAAAQGSSSVTWTTTGITTPIKQKLVGTFTPQKAGLLVWRVVVAKVSTTLYVDPKPTVA